MLMLPVPAFFALMLAYLALRSFLSGGEVFAGRVSCGLRAAIARRGSGGGLWHRRAALGLACHGGDHPAADLADLSVKPVSHRFMARDVAASCSTALLHILPDIRARHA